MVKPQTPPFPSPITCNHRIVVLVTYTASVTKPQPAVLSIEQSTKQIDQSTHHPDFIDGHNVKTSDFVNEENIYNSSANINEKKPYAQSHYPLPHQLVRLASVGRKA